MTNGFRSEWGAWTYAAFRTAASTVGLQGRTVPNTPRNVLAMPIAAAPRWAITGCPNALSWFPSRWVCSCDWLGFVQTLQST